MVAQPVRATPGQGFAWQTVPTVIRLRARSCGASPRRGDTEATVLICGAPKTLELRIGRR